MAISLRRKLGLALAFALAAIVLSGSAFAQCTPAAPVNNMTVTCTGTVTNQNPPNGYGTGVENGLTINVTAGANVTGTTTPGNGVSIANGNIINNLGTITGAANGVIFPGFSESIASSNGGSTAQAFGEAGYRIELSGLNLPGLGSTRARIEPFAGAAAILIHENGFTENGGAAALTGFARDFDLETTTLGVRGELAFASMPLTLKTMLGWRHAFGDVVPSLLLAFQGGAQGFNVAGVPIDRDAFVAEAGLDYALTSSLTAGVSYSGQFGARAMDNSIRAHLTLSF